MTLQEYLVKLGFSVDEPSFKKFIGAVASAGAGAAELGSVALETAAAVELMVTKVARGYEALYYASARTGQSVKYIQATQFGFKQIGLSAEEANHSIESIAATLRTQPWLKAIFGGADTPQKVATNLGKSGLPYFLQARFASMIGLDEKTLLHLQLFGEKEAKFEADSARRRKAAGIDGDKLAKTFTEKLIPALNTLEDDLEIFGERMAQNFIDPVTHGIERMDAMVQWLTRADVATKGWISTLATLAGSVGGIWLVEKVLGRLFGAKGGTLIGRALGGAAGAVGSGAAFPLAAGAGAVGAAYFGQQKFGPFLPGSGGAYAPGAGGKSGNSNARLAQAVEFFKQAGFPAEAAQGIAAGLFSESGLNPGAVNPTSGASGIAQWLGARKSGLKQKYGENSSFEDQLKYVLYELTQGAETATGKDLYQGGMKPSEAARRFIHGFERPGAAGEASDMRTAGPLADSLSGLVPQQTAGDTKNISVTAKTDIHIHGDADSNTAKQVKDAGQDNNQNLARVFDSKTR